MSKISRAFFSNSEKNPEKTAICCGSVSLTYRQFSAVIKKYIHFFNLKNVKRGDAIGLLLPNSIDFVAFMIMAADIGVTLVPLNNSLPLNAVHKAFKASGVKHVIANADVIESIIKDKDYDFTFVNGLWLSIDEEVIGINSKKDLINYTGEDFQPLFQGTDDDPFILTMTSGSTGDPKPITLKQITKFNRAHSAIEMYNVTPEDRVLAATPLYHSLAERLVLIPLLIGGTSVLMERYSPNEWLRTVEEKSVSFTIAVSSQLAQISKQLMMNNNNLMKSMRCIVSSSAQLDSSIKSDLLSKLKCEFHECYGTSEIAIATTLNVTKELSKLDSVGKPGPGIVVKIINDKEEEIKTGEIGEIVCSTPMLFAGYYLQPEQTKKAMWKNYFKTGDLGKMDDEGYLYYIGRKKEIIITGGINVYPQDIDSAIKEFNGIKECATFSLPDDNLGEIVAVALVPVNENEFNLRSLKIHCAKVLADFQQPRKYYILTELPKNDMGKIMKRMLPEICSIKTAN
ncbi:MAG: acyl--CoA ligase [Ignavibacteriaceae bacterium]|nr:acyl--CoA ligase [Ignavibacteriaceae bacterium]